MSFDDLVHHITAFLADLPQGNRSALHILLGLVLGFIIGRSRRLPAFSYQNRGEKLVSDAVQKHFRSPDYHLMNHVTLRMRDGTTQIDHILVSRFGVFVLETKSFKGWLFANAVHAKWTQVLFGDNFTFQNPILQNRRHIRAVEGILDFLPPGAIRSAVVFTGDAEFKTAAPQGVYSISGLVKHLREQTAEVMSLNRVQFCVGRLETARLAVSGQTDVEHVQSLDRRHGRAV